MYGWTRVDELVSFVVATGMIVSVYLWTMAVGAGQRTEIRVGVAGIVAFVGWAVLGFVMYGLTHRWANEPGVTGVVVALVVGVGTFVSEVQPGLMTFWRSRPISPSKWFWTKYLTGLAAVLLFLLVPILLFCVAAWTLGGEVLPNGEPFGRSRVGPWPLLWAFASVTCLAYSIAVCLTCLVRQAVYAGILSLGLLLVAFSITSFVAFIWWLQWFDVQHVYQFTLFLFCTSVLAVAMLVLAWQSAVRDWGQKC